MAMQAALIVVLPAHSVTVAPAWAVPPPPLQLADSAVDLEVRALLPVAAVEEEETNIPITF